MPTAGWWSLIGPIFKAMSGAPVRLARDMIGSLPGVEYYRLQPTLGFGAHHAMDNVTPQNTAALRQTAEAYIAQNAEALGHLAARLQI